MNLNTLNRFTLFNALTIVVALSLGGCANKPSLDRATIFKNTKEFRPGPEGGVDLYWANPSIKNRDSLQATINQYDSAILDRVYVVVDESTRAHLDDQEIKAINKYLIEKLKERLGKRFKIVDTPSDKTLRISLAVSNIETPNPILATTSSVLPVGIGISMISWIATGEHTNTGNATMEIMISDASTNEPILAAIDRRSGNKDFSSIVDNTDDIKDAINGWVEQLGKAINPPN